MQSICFFMKESINGYDLLDLQLSQQLYRFDDFREATLNMCHLIDGLSSAVDSTLIKDGPGPDEGPKADRRKPQSFPPESFGYESISIDGFDYVADSEGGVLYKDERDRSQIAQIEILDVRGAISLEVIG